jgi:predicted glycoside hydrolase/deacetylase ChbG (UPF0249 family)
VLGDVDWDIVTEFRHETLVDLLVDMDGAFNERDLDFFLKQKKLAKEILDEMRCQQLAVNDLLGLVQKILDGHESVENLGQARAKLKEKHRETHT